MYIATEYRLIALSEAKKRFKANEEVLRYKKCVDLSGCGYYPIDSKEELIAGKIYEKVLVEYPNKFESSYLSVTKNHDGTHDFYVGDDYDIYETTIVEGAAKELAKFLLESYVPGEDE